MELGWVLEEWYKVQINVFFIDFTDFVCNLDGFLHVLGRVPCHE